MVSLQAGQKSLSLETEIAPSVGRIIADRRAVQQMLINLLSNAVKFTPGGRDGHGGRERGSARGCISG